MKEGKLLITFIIAAISGVLAIHCGVHMFNAFHEPYHTTLVYAYTAYDSVEADGFLVRDEVVLPNQSGIVELTRDEGEKVGIGQTVALIHRDTQAQADQAQIRALTQEIKLLEYAMNRSRRADSVGSLDEDILRAIVSLRSSTALGDYSHLENQVRILKSDILKRGFTYGDTLTTTALTAQLQNLTGQLAFLKQRSATGTTQVVSDQSGIFSSFVDGYESQLTFETVMDLTPSAVSRLSQNHTGGQASGLGKLIVSNLWYFAAAFPADITQRLDKGDTALLRFTGDFTQDVPMTVEKISKPEDDMVTVIFSSNRYLSQTTLLRRQSVELIFDSWSGLRIPKSALRLVEKTVMDEQTGEIRPTTSLGVYTLVNGRAEFKEVTVLKEGKDYYVVDPVQIGRRTLRVGDEIITQATDLQDGQRIVLD